MIVIERTVDISRPVQTETLRGNEFKQEANAHTFRISVVINGAAVALTGSVSASMLLADGSGLTLGGSLDNGVAVLTLPQAAYGVPGRFLLAIYSVQTGATEAETVKTCIYACVGAVINTYGDQQYDPGNLIPDAETLAAYIEACQTATAAANDAAGRAETAALTAVTYAEQTGKTEAEKRQARTNIGAVDETMFEAVTGFVPFDGTDGSASNRNCTVTRVGQRYTIKRTAAHTSNSDFSLMPNMHGANASSSGSNFNTWCAEATLKLVPGRRYRVALRVVSGAMLGGSFNIRLRNESNTSLSSQAVSTERTSVDFTFSGTYFAIMLYVASAFYTGETPLVFDLTLTEIPASASIADTEQVVAKESHAAGDLMMVSGQLYKATQAIVSGDTVTPGVNVEETTIAAQLAALEARIAALEG